MNHSNVKPTTKKRAKAVLSVFLVVAILIAGAYAFLSATDSKTNVFTVGNVSIKLKENFDTDLSGIIEDDEKFDETVKTISLEDGKSIMPGQEILKQPHIENNGKNPAYVFLAVGIPTKEWDAVYASEKEKVGTTTITDATIEIKAFAIQQGYANKKTSEDIWNAYITNTGVDNLLGTKRSDSTQNVEIFELLNLGADWTATDIDNSNMYPSSDGHNYYIYRYTVNEGLLNARQRTTNLFEKVKLITEIGEFKQKPFTVNYYVPKDVLNANPNALATSAATNSSNQSLDLSAVTCTRTETYQDATELNLSFDASYSLQGCSFDWKVAQINSDAQTITPTSQAAYDGMVADRTLNLLAENIDISDGTDVANYLTYFITKDNNNNYFAVLTGADAKSCPTTPETVNVPAYVTVKNGAMINGKPCANQVIVLDGVNGSLFELPENDMAVPVLYMYVDETHDSSENLTAFYNVAQKLILPNTIKSLYSVNPGYEENGMRYSSNKVLQEINIPYSVQKIGDSCFSFCENLKYISLPNTLKSIGYVAFSGCKNLNAITIPDSVTYIGGGVFDYTGIYNNDNNWTDGVLYVDKWALGCKASSKNDFSVLEGSVGISIEYNITKYDGISLSLPSTMMHIGYLGDIISTITVNKSNPYFSSEDGVLYNKEKTELIFYPKNNSKETYAIPNTVTKIKDEAFAWGPGALKNIEIPNSVTYIGSKALCGNFTSITIPDSVQYIGSYAFTGNEQTVINIKQTTYDRLVSQTSNIFEMFNGSFNFI